MTVYYIILLLFMGNDPNLDSIQIANSNNLNPNLDDLNMVHFFNFNACRSTYLIND